MNLPLPHQIFLCILVIYISLRAYYQIQAARHRKSVSKATLGDWLLVAFIVTGQVVLPLFLCFSTWIDFAKYSLPPAAMWCGTLIMLFGLWLFWRSHADLGKNWSVTLELNPDHKLITQGVYHSIRHPMYASFFLLGLGQGFLLNNWLAGWTALVSTALLYVIRIPNEERMMLECFGQEYQDYKCRAGGVIPFWGEARSPEQTPE